MARVFREISVESIYYYRKNNTDSILNIQPIDQSTQSEPH